MTWIDQLPLAAATRASNQPLAAAAATLLAAGGAMPLPDRRSLLATTVHGWRLAASTDFRP